MQETYVTGVSMRKVSPITEKLCGTGFSKSRRLPTACVDSKGYRHAVRLSRYRFVVTNSR